MPPTFRVDVVPERDGVRVCPVGDIDISTAGSIREQIDALVSDGFSRVILDLRDTRFLDSTGLLENALLPAERAMVDLGEDQRVREQRVFMQAATAHMFIAAVEELTGRKVRAFSGAVDPAAEVVFEILAFEPEDRSADGDGHRPIDSIDST